MPDSTADGTPPDPQQLLRSRSYVRLLVLAALMGLPVSGLAYGFLALAPWLQDALFTDLPRDLGFASAPVWWPLPLLTLSGLLVALAIRRLPGIGGRPPPHGFQAGGPPPADGFRAAGPVPPVELPGIFCAALATLALGAVLGPEAPLILMGSGLGVLAVRLTSRDAPPRAAAVMAATGSFAAISSLLGSPLIGAFLLLEASGLGGPTLLLVLVPGLLAAGLGTLIFLGLDSLTGLGTFTLAVPGLPAFDHLTVAMFGWALLLGALAPFLGRGISWLAVAVRARVEPRMLLLTPVLGLTIGALAIGFAEATGKDASFVLFSGQSALGPLVDHSTEWSIGALLLLAACKAVAYALSLSSFRGGPVFPAVFIGAAGGVLASHLPGLPLIPAVAMGIGAMCTVMLTLPLTATLLATLLLGADGVQAMPVVIVAVVVAYVVTARITPVPEATAAAEPDVATPAPVADRPRAAV